MQSFPNEVADFMPLGAVTITNSEKISFAVESLCKPSVLIYFRWPHRVLASQGIMSFLRGGSVENVVKNSWVRVRWVKSFEEIEGTQRLLFSCLSFSLGSMNDCSMSRRGDQIKVELARLVRLLLFLNLAILQHV